MTSQYNKFNWQAVSQSDISTFDCTAIIDRSSRESDDGPSRYQTDIQLRAPLLTLSVIHNSRLKEKSITNTDSIQPELRVDF